MSGQESMPLTRIGQTSKTMVLEEFCLRDGVLRLDTLLRGYSDNKEELFDRIDKGLSVRSFQEFVVKFMPSVWAWQEVSQDAPGGFRFRYSLEEPPAVTGATELKLSDNEFYNTVMSLYDKKGVSAFSNGDFDYSCVERLLSPQQVLEDAKRLRGDLRYSYQKCLELKDGPESERRRWGKKFKTTRSEIVRQYKSSLAGQIKLALADTEKQLEGHVSEDGGKQLPAHKDTPPLPCYPRFKDDGDIEVIWDTVEPASALPARSEDGRAAEQEALVRYIGKDFDETSGEMASGFVRDLVVRCYAGGTPATALSPKELEERRDQLATLYKSSQDEFIRVISAAVEKMLDVKAFFDHASVDGADLPAPVIIANCTAAQLMDGRTKELFRKMVKDYGEERDVNKMWFAILPAVYDEELSDEDDEGCWDDWDDDLDPLDMPETDRGGSARAKDVTRATMQDVDEIMKIMRDGKIMTFFNFKGSVKTGFSHLNAARIKGYRDKLRGVDRNEYAVFAYPNFTILPREYTSIKVSARTVNGKTQDVRLNVPGIYVDAAYIAAGLVVGSQNPAYLKSKGYKINSGLPCVRFDLEAGENRLTLHTLMNQELKYRWASDIDQEIGDDHFGFCFCGNNKAGASLKNSYVYTARTMGMGKDGVYRPIYKRLTRDLIEQLLLIKPSAAGKKVSRGDVEDFIRSDVSLWKRMAQSDVDQYANNILQPGDDIVTDENDPNKIQVVLGKDSEMSELEIEVE